MPARITNKHDLPEMFVRAAKYDGHRTLGDVSVTRLIDSPKIHHLKEKHEYEEDVMDRVWMMLGTGVHYALERANNKVRQARVIHDFFSVLAEMKEYVGEEKKNKIDKLKKFVESELLSELPGADDDRYETEKTLTMDVEGLTISGTRDVKDKETNTIIDYKVTSAYAFMYPENLKKWKAQLNIYRLLEEMNGGKVDGLQVMAIFKDWSPSAYQRSNDYPDAPIKVIDLDLINEDKLWEYVKKRAQKHKRAMNGDVPNCTPAEKWSESDQYAVKKEGAKKAVRVFTDEDAAKDFMANTKYKYKGKLYIENRPGTDKRCENFCPVKMFCDQYKEYYYNKYGINPDGTSRDGIDPTQRQWK